MKKNSRRKLQDVTNKINKVLEIYGEPEKCKFVEDRDLVYLEEESSELFEGFRIVI